MDNPNTQSEKPLPPYSTARKKALLATALLLLLITAVTTSIVLMTIETIHFQSLTTRSQMTPYEANRVNVRSLFNIFSYLGLYLSTGICFFVWLHQVSKNMWSLSDPGDPPKETPGWAIGWWFVPIAAFFKPYQVVKEIWKRSHPPPAKSRLILLWWILLLVNTFAINAYISGGDTTEVATVVSNNNLATGAGILILIDATLAIILIWQITNGQQRQNLTRERGTPRPRADAAPQPNRTPWPPPPGDRTRENVTDTVNSETPRQSADTTERFRWPTTTSEGPQDPTTPPSSQPETSSPKNRNLIKFGLPTLFVTTAILATGIVTFLVTSQDSDTPTHTPAPPGPAVNIQESNRLLQLGRSAYDQGNYQEALDHLKSAQASRVFPDPVIQNEIGLTLGLLHQYDQAIHYYTNSIHLDDDPSTRINRGFAFLGAGRWQEANTDAHEALKQLVLTDQPQYRRTDANEILAYSAAKLERHEEALQHMDLAIQNAGTTHLSGSWIQRLTNFVDMVNEVRRGRGSSADIVIFPALQDMTEGLAWLETGDTQRAKHLIENSLSRHQGESWFLESAMAKALWQLGAQEQSATHHAKAILLRDQLQGPQSNQTVVEALRKCDLQASSRPTYGTYQWSTCPQEGLTPLTKQPDQDRASQISAIYQYAKKREESTPIPEPTPLLTPTPRPTAAPLPSPTPFILRLSTPAPINAPSSNLIPTPTPNPIPTVKPLNTSSRVIQTITTGMGQTLDITVQGFDNSPAMFNLLVQIINQEEQLLGIPFPSPKLTMKRTNQMSGGFCGNYQPFYKPRYAGDPYIIKDSNINLRVDEHCDDTFGSIAHEVAHAWFHGNDPQDWIDEGLANSIEQQMNENNPAHRTVYPPRTYCETYRNISQLEAARPARHSSTSASGFTCNYRLGSGIFESLREHLGTQAFNKAIALLARRDTNTTDRANTVEDVKTFLGLDTRALEIIHLWYAGQPEMNPFRTLNLVDYSHPPTLDGEYLHFAGTIMEQGVIHELILGPDPFCSQFHLSQGLSETQPVGGLADQLPVGWRHNSTPKAAIINSEINSETGEFAITARVNDDRLLGIEDLSLEVISRVSTEPDGKCEESTTFSQVMVDRGSIPHHRKRFEHYHNHQIAWDWIPQVNNYQIHLSGQAPPGSLKLHHTDEYCGQLHLYRMDEGGYHRLSNVNTILPAGSQWPSTPGAELISGSVSDDGRFEAIIQIWDATLLNHPHVVLGVNAPSRADRSTNQCASTETMSAVTLQSN